MKIGSIDIAPPMLVYTALLALVVIVTAALWSAGKDLLVESWHGDNIIKAMYKDDNEAYAAGIDSCLALIKRYPAKMGARLYLGAMQYKQGRYAEAQDAWKGVSVHPAASAEEKAWALTGMGACVFYAADKEKRAAAAVESQKFFSQALAVMDLPDARVNLALAETWKPEAAWTEVDSQVSKALAAQMPPALESAQQLYFLQGLLLARQGKPAEGAAGFDRAIALRPNWKEADDARRFAMLSSLGQKNNMDEKTQRDILEKLWPIVNTFGSQKVAALNVMGVAYARLKGSSDYMTGPYSKAVQAFKNAMSEFPKDPRAYQNLGGLYEERIGLLTKTLAGTVTGFTGETSEKNTWLNPKGKEKPRFLSADADKIPALKTLLRDEEIVWQNFYNNGAQSTAEKVDARLRQLSCMRRQIWLMDGAEISQQRPGALAHAADVALQLAALDPANETVQYTLGLVLLEKSDRSGALSSFKKAKSAGYASPSLDGLLASLGGASQITDVYPRTGSREFGAKPLILATLKGDPSAFKEIKLKLDASNVLPEQLGSQLCYLPTDSELAGGAHTVALKLTDTSGGVVSSEFNFYIDKKPPVWTVTPGNEKPIDAQATWSVTVSDGLEGSGVDFSTLNVGLKSVGSNRMDLGLIKDGRYKLPFPKIAVKAGDAVTTSPFKVAPEQTLIAGQYQLSIEVKDQAGNVLSDGKVFTVR